ncbi:hypothetical protein [Psychrobacter sp. 72-O-c]|uniref:hypothetical protein n=1 Tax=Psychrobacter sp. 72-O-c TaxID=2774125 RepID=UPI00191886C9|nr:hypothetical protein [Psychrobacter sp. 72-O-c]
MKTIYQHIETSHHRTEKLDMHKCGQGVYIGIHKIQEMPYGELDEARESIVVPYSEIPELVCALQKTVDETAKDYTVIRMNGSKLELVLSIIELAIPIAENRINVPVALYEFKKELEQKLEDINNKDGVTK